MDTVVIQDSPALRVFQDTAASADRMERLREVASRAFLGRVGIQGLVLLLVTVGSADSGLAGHRVTAGSQGHRAIVVSAGHLGIPASPEFQVTAVTRDSLARVDIRGFQELLAIQVLRAAPATVGSQVKVATQGLQEFLDTQVSRG